MSNQIRVILADDHTVLRVGMKAYLEDQTSPEFKVVAEAASGREAIDLVAKHNPDLLILDLSMPEMGGLETTIQLRKDDKKLKILILTQYAESIYVKRVFEAGANGYILKSARGEELMVAIRSVMAGGTFIDPSMASALITPTQKEQTPQHQSDEQLYAKLTPREQQILKLIADGCSNKEIASHLDLAVKTVMVHRANLMDKIGIKNRSKLIQFAIRVGVITMKND